MFNRLTRSALTLLLSNLGGAALAFVLSVLIGRALGQDGLGVYATALAWVFPLALMAEFGLGTLVTREVAHDPSAAATLLHVAARARLALGGGLMLLLVIAAPALSRDALVVRGLQLSAPLVVILPFFSLFSAVFRAHQQMWPLPWLNIGMLAIQIPVTILAFQAGGGALAALAINTLTSAGQLTAAWWIYRRWFHAEDKPRPLPLAPVLRRAWPFALAALLAALQIRIGAILLEQLADTSQAGYYAAASRLAEAGRIIPNAFFGALLPALAALSQDLSALDRLFRRTAWGLAAFGALAAAAGALFASDILRLTYGAAFIPAEPALSAALWGLLPGLLRGGRTLYWYARGREQYTNGVTALTLAGQVALSLWLIPPYGAAGAALAALAADAAACALLWLPLRLRATTRQYTLAG